MTWHLTESVDEFYDTAGDFLRSRPVEHTVPLTVIETLRQRGPHAYGPDDPIFGWWRAADGRVDGAFFQTPPHPLLVLAAPAVPELAELLADRPLPAVSALTADAEAFAAAWRRLTGAEARTGRQMRLYRLDALTPPAPLPPGSARIADARDRGLLLAWMDEFHAEIGEELRNREELVDDRLSFGGLTLWELDGSPVSMAGLSRAEAGMVRVVTVYTPKQARGHGYGGAVTSAVSRAALDAGVDDVVLFTDLANPTSNALYQRLGYRPIEDRTVLEFIK
jgi:RimJ/RimL family protein N-acetyltransferase